MTTEHTYHIYERNCWTPDPKSFRSKGIDEVVGRIEEQVAGVTVVQYVNPSLIVKYAGDQKQLEQALGKLPFGVRVEQFPDDWKPSKA